MLDSVRRGRSTLPTAFSPCPNQEATFLATPPESDWQQDQGPREATSSSAHQSWTRGSHFTLSKNPREVQGQAQTDTLQMWESFRKPPHAPVSPAFFLSLPSTREFYTSRKLIFKKFEAAPSPSTVPRPTFHLQ